MLSVQRMRSSRCCVRRSRIIRKMIESAVTVVTDLQSPTGTALTCAYEINNLRRMMELLTRVSRVHADHALHYELLLDALTKKHDHRDAGLSGQTTSCQPGAPAWLISQASPPTSTRDTDASAVQRRGRRNWGSRAQHGSGVQQPRRPPASQRAQALPRSDTHVLI